MQNIQSRRKFIIKSSKLLTIMTGVISFGKYVSFSPSVAKAKSLSCNSGNKNKILVAYESQFGSTEEVARFVGKSLSECQEEIEVKKIEEINDLSPYSKVIIGSAIQYDKWMPEASEFVLLNKKVLGNIPVAFFFTCLVLSKKTEKAVLQAEGYSDNLKTLVTEINPVSVGQFAGVLNYSKMSFMQRILAKGLFAVIGIKEGDYRDWNLIKGWTEKLKF